MENTGVRRFFYERLMSKAIRHAFPQFSASYASLARVRSLITDELYVRGSATSSGRRLDFNDVRERVWYLLSPHEIHEVLCDVLEREGGRLGGGEGDSFSSLRNQDFFDGEYGEFCSLTGLSGYAQPHPVLPVSVLDTRFAHMKGVREAFLEGAVEVFVDDRVLGNDGLSPLNVGRVEHAMWFSRGDSRVYGTMGSVEDRSGFFAFEEFIDKDERENVQSCLVRLVEMGEEMSEFGIASGRAVCEYLADSGLSFELKSGRNPGQLVAMCRDGMQVRVADSRSDEKFVGRTYNRGVVYRFATTRRSSRGTDLYEPRSVEQVLDQIRGARGVPLRGFLGSGDLVGQYSYRDRVRNHAYRGSVRWSRNVGVIDGGYVQLVGEGVTGFNFIGAEGDYSVVGRFNGFRRVFDEENSGSYGVFMPRFAEYVDEDMNWDDEELVDRCVADIVDAYERLGVDAFAVDDCPHVEGVSVSSIGDVFASWHVGSVLGVEFDGDGDVFDERLRLALDSLSDEDRRAVFMRGIVRGMESLGAAWEFDEQNQYVRIHNSAVCIQSLPFAGSFGQKREFFTHLLQVFRENGGQVDVYDFDVSRVGERLANEVQAIFDSARAVPGYQVGGLVGEVAEDIVSVLRFHGGRITGDDVLYDAQTGVFEWRAEMPTTESARPDGSDYVTRWGRVGQLFDSHRDFGGVDFPDVTEKSGWKVFIPAAHGRLVGDDESVRVRERVRVFGYGHMMREAVRQRLVCDMSEPYRADHISGVGSNVSLNNTVRHMEGVSFSRDFVDGLSSSEFLSQVEKVAWKNILETYSRSVAFSGSRFDSLFAIDSAPFDDERERNMTVMGTMTNIFDSALTSSGDAQGRTRYLLPGVSVNSDGSLSVPDDVQSQYGFGEFARFNTFDRQQMSSSNFMRQEGLATNVKVACLPLGGFTYDDAFVISKEFSEDFRKNNGDGQATRILKVGDKLVDMHGNKGVISLIVDRDSDVDSLSDMERRAVELFRDNPSLDVVTSPFSFVSRMNAGFFHEAQEGEISDLYVEGKRISGGLTEHTIIVAEQLAEKKTKVYGAGDRGRKAGGQLLWALQSFGADAKEIVEYLYGDSSQALWDVREYMRVCGLNVDDNNVLGFARDCSFDCVDDWGVWEEIGVSRGKLDTVLHERVLKRGFVDLPFSLALPEAVREGGGDSFSSRLWLMDSMLRETVEGEEGSWLHDFSREYERIARACYDFVNAEGKANKESLQEKAVKSAQDAFDVLCRDVIDKKLTGKHNVLKEKGMAHFHSRSATSVWVPDPDCALDCVRLSEDMARKMGVIDGDCVLVWRDPVLRAGGVRAFRVEINGRGDDCIGINPCIDASFDGDFDGDTVGVVPIRNPRVAESALKVLSPRVMSNWIDFSTHRGTDFGLFVRDDLDIAVAHHHDNGLSHSYGVLVDKINRGIHVDFDDLDSHVRQCFDVAFGKSVVRFDSLESHLDSINEGCVVPGAKGSVSKLQDYKEQVEGKCKDTRAVSFATAVKAHGTGIAGSFSQKVVAAIRQEDIRAATEVTYPVTQAILQAKHDPVDAQRRFALCSNVLKDVWNGALPQKNADGTWGIARDANGKWKLCDKNRWVAAVKELYRDSDGLGVDVSDELIDSVAHALSSVTGDMVGVKNTEGYVADYLAYGKSFQRYVECAREGRVLDLEAMKYGNMSATEDMLKNEFNKNQSIPIIEDPYKDYGHAVNMAMPHHRSVLTHGNAWIEKSSHESEIDIV